MAARILPLGHKEEPTRGQTRVVASDLSQKNLREQPSGLVAGKTEQARRDQQRRLHRRIMNARHNSTHLRPTTQNRALGGFANEANLFGAAGA